MCRWCCIKQGRCSQKGSATSNVYNFHKDHARKYLSAEVGVEHVKHLEIKDSGSLLCQRWWQYLASKAGNVLVKGILDQKTNSDIIPGMGNDDYKDDYDDDYDDGDNKPVAMNKEGSSEKVELGESEVGSLGSCRPFQSCKK